jgi:hypothetical protein
VGPLVSHPHLSLCACGPARSAILTSLSMPHVDPPLTDVFHVLYSRMIHVFAKKKFVNDVLLVLGFSSVASAAICMPTINYTLFRGSTNTCLGICVQLTAHNISPQKKAQPTTHSSVVSLLKNLFISLVFSSPTTSALELEADGPNSPVVPRLPLLCVQQLCSTQPLFQQRRH